MKLLIYYDFHPTKFAFIRIRNIFVIYLAASKIGHTVVHYIIEKKKFTKPLEY